MEIPLYNPESIGSAGEADVIDEPVGHPSDACVIVIFSASGDLTKTRKCMDAFVAKGRLKPLLEAIPVRVITNGKVAWLGAARFAMQQAS